MPLGGDRKTRAVPPSLFILVRWMILKPFPRPFLHSGQIGWRQERGCKVSGLGRFLSELGRTFGAYSSDLASSRKVEPEIASSA